MNGQELVFCSETELSGLLIPIDDQMNLEGVPFNIRAMKGWHLFMRAQHLDIPLRDPASDRIIGWFRDHARQSL